MGMTSSGSKAVNAEINVTPLIDVLLVLLIIFMVIVPTAVRGLDTLIPQPPKSTEPIEPNPQPIVVEVLGNAHDVTYKINAAALGRAEIAPKLAGIFAVRTDKTMFIKGDADLDFSSVAEVIDSARQAGADNVAIITPQTGRFE